AILHRKGHLSLLMRATHTFELSHRNLARKNQRLRPAADPAKEGLQSDFVFLNGWQQLATQSTLISAVKPERRRLIAAGCLCRGRAFTCQYLASPCNQLRT